MISECGQTVNYKTVTEHFSSVTVVLFLAKPDIWLMFIAQPRHDKKAGDYANRNKKYFPILSQLSFPKHLSKVAATTPYVPPPHLNSVSWLPFRLQALSFKVICLLLALTEGMQGRGTCGQRHTPTTRSLLPSSPQKMVTIPQYLR
jgi:hypothetical protein